MTKKIPYGLVKKIKIKSFKEIKKTFDNKSSNSIGFTKHVIFLNHMKVCCGLWFKVKDYYHKTLLNGTIVHKFETNNFTFNAEWVEEYIFSKGINENLPAVDSM